MVIGLRDLLLTWSSEVHSINFFDECKREAVNLHLEKPILPRKCRSGIRRDKLLPVENSDCGGIISFHIDIYQSFIKAIVVSLENRFFKSGYSNA